jgi:hypothetical protein
LRVLMPPPGRLRERHSVAQGRVGGLHSLHTAREIPAGDEVQAFNLRFHHGSFFKIGLWEGSG